MLVPERDAAAIANRLQYYMDAPEALVTEGAMLRDRIRSHFDARTHAAALSDLYDAVRRG